MTILERQRRLIEIKKEMQRIKSDAENQTQQLAEEAYELRREITLDGAGIDLEKVERARAIISVRGSFSRGGDDRQSVIDDAIHQIASGGGNIDRENLGTKSYDRWNGQRCDCKPGYGPTHGSIIFQVGLTKEIRDSGGCASLTDEQREDALYLLTRLGAVQKLELEAKAA